MRQKLTRYRWLPAFAAGIVLIGGQLVGEATAPARVNASSKPHRAPNEVEETPARIPSNVEPQEGPAESRTFRIRVQPERDSARGEGRRKGDDDRKRKKGKKSSRGHRGDDDDDDD